MQGQKLAVLPVTTILFVCLFCLTYSIFSVIHTILKILSIVKIIVKKLNDHVYLFLFFRNAGVELCKVCTWKEQTYSHVHPVAIVNIWCILAYIQTNSVFAFVFYNTFSNILKQKQTKKKEKKVMLWV